MLENNLEKRFLSVRELATYLGYGELTIRIWMKKKFIPYYKIGKTIRFDIHQVHLWLKDRQQNKQGMIAS